MTAEDRSSEVGGAKNVFGEFQKLISSLLSKRDPFLNIGVDSGLP